MRSKYCTIILLIFLVNSCGQSGNHNKSNTLPPNIIYILADDLGYGDISALNPESAIKTPNMNRLVNEGISFDDAHSSSAVCTPTRYGILTGEYCWRTSLKKGVTWGYSAPLIQPHQQTVASFLQDQGYRTGVVGKWHLGLGWQRMNGEKPIELYDSQYLFDKVLGSNVDYSKSVTGGPNDLGFEYSYIFPSSLDMTPYLYLENGRATDLPTGYTEGKEQSKDGRGVFWRAGEVTPGFEFDKVLDHLVNKGIDFITGQDERPFFLYLPLTAPHTPWLPTEETIGTSQAGRYGDFVKLVDNKIGKILSVLDQLDLAENTMVVLSSDNGAHWTPEDKSQYDHRANFVYRGQKADIYEGGHRIPYLIRWPRQIAPRSTSNQLFSTTDFMATTGGLLGVPIPEGSAPDSHDQSDVILGKTSNKLVRTVMIQHSLNGLFAIRQGSWKYTPVLGSGGFSDPALIQPAEGDPNGALYDLSEDISESKNLLDQFSEKGQSMHEELERITGQRF